jgi:hypothetical protein
VKFAVYDALPNANLSNAQASDVGKIPQDQLNLDNGPAESVIRSSETRRPVPKSDDRDIPSWQPDIVL